jgi:transcription elongation factor Elf1
VQKLLTKILKLNSKNSKKQESPIKKQRTCSKCGEEKPLNTEHYQIVKYFKEGYSFYCNVCNAPKKRD